MVLWGLWALKTAEAPRWAGLPKWGMGWRRSGVLHFVDNSFEGCGVVEGEVGENFAVDLDARLVDEAHEFAVAEVFLTGGCVDTLDPEGTEVALLVLAVAVGVGETFFPGVLGDGPHVAAATEIAAGEFQDFLTFCA